jgi:hypothetical protein
MIRMIDMHFIASKKYRRSNITGIQYYQIQTMNNGYCTGSFYLIVSKPFLKKFPRPHGEPRPLPGYSPPGYQHNTLNPVVPLTQMRRKIP